MSVSPPARRTVLRAGALPLAAFLTGCHSGQSTRQSASGTRLVVEDGTFTSSYWPDRVVGWHLVRPAPGTARGCVIALHGKGGSASDWFEGLNVPAHLSGTGLAVAAVDGADRYWHKRRDGTDTGAMVLRDFLPFLERRGIATVRLGFLGLSMGGYGALLLATRLPRARVMGVATMSAALWLAPGETARGAFDDREDFLANNVFARTAALRRLPVWMACGTADPFILGNRKLAHGLPNAVTRFDSGGHTAEYWASHVGPALTWLGSRS